MSTKTEKEGEYYGILRRGSDTFPAWLTNLTTSLTIQGLFDTINEVFTRPISSEELPHKRR